MKKTLLLNIVLIISISFGSLVAQNLNGTYFSIEWISNFSYEEDVKKEDSFLSEIFNFIVGEKHTKLIKPFSIVKLDSNSYFILDQGRFLPVLITDEGFKTINNEKFMSFPSLVGVCQLSDGIVLFSDSKLAKIFSYDVGNDILEVFIDCGGLVNPTGLAFDRIQKLIYITDTSNHRIIVCNMDGRLVRTIGERGVDDGQFNFPTFLTLDNEGKIYVVDAMNFRIQIFDKDGKFIKKFGEAGDATGYFSRPKGIAVDSYGHIFIVDALFHIVQVFDFNGNFLYNFGGMGQENSRFWLPTGISIDSQNNILVADSYNSRIQVFRLIDAKK